MYLYIKYLGSMRIDWRNRGVHKDRPVDCVLPGLISTPALPGILGGFDSGCPAQLNTKEALRREGG